MWSSGYDFYALEIVSFLSELFVLGFEALATGSLAAPVLHFSLGGSVMALMQFSIFPTATNSNFLP